MPVLSCMLHYMEKNYNNRKKKLKIGQIFITTLESAENFTAQNSAHKKPQFLQTPAVLCDLCKCIQCCTGFLKMEPFCWGSKCGFASLTKESTKGRRSQRPSLRPEGLYFTNSSNQYFSHVRLQRPQRWSARLWTSSRTKSTGTINILQQTRNQAKPLI